MVNICEEGTVMWERLRIPELGQSLEGGTAADPSVTQTQRSHSKKKAEADLQNVTLNLTCVAFWHTAEEMA